jgi:glycosyltransferase involved in cell wall biosynthesis
MANYASFAKSASITGTFFARPDIVIGSSPQLLCALAAWWISCVKRVPFVFEVRDLWPESLDAVGLGGEHTRLYRILRSVSNFLYKHADHIVVVTPAFKDEIVRNYGITPGRISIVLNGVETNIFTPVGAGRRSELGLADRFVVGYIGTMGNAHGLSTVLEAADQLRNTAPQVRFLFVGEGAEKQHVKSQIEQKRLTNILLLDGQPRETIAALIRSTDVCLVPLKKSEVFKTVIPTKMLEFMACGRAVILAVEGQAQQLLESAQAGICIEPENPVQLASAILNLSRDPALAARLGTSGREYIVNNLSRERTARDYDQVLRRVLAIPMEAAAAGGTA